MASTRSAVKAKAAISLEDFGCDILRRRAAIGEPLPVPRNSGKRRTASKRALLEAIKKAGGEW